MPVPVVVIRHRKERIAKCSLRFLHGRPDITFHRAAGEFAFDASGYTLLMPQAPPLTAADAARPLLLLDSTWRYLPQLMRRVRGSCVLRAIPAGVRTAYPRCSRTFADPCDGLASVEALYVAKLILRDEDPSILDGYHWRVSFLSMLSGLGTNPCGSPPCPSKS